MNDQELEKLLIMGKKESEDFFSHTDVSSARKVVLHNIASGEEHRLLKPRRVKAVPSAIKFGAAAACLVLVLAAFLGLFNSRPATHAPQQTASLAEQSVTLDEAGKNYLVSFFPVNQPNYREQSLMGVLWKMGNGGTSHMVYSSLFEMCDEPYPVSIIGSPDTTGKMLLLSSGDSQKKYLHYRLVGFINGDATTLWSEDFVPDGRLGVQGGMVVEQREPIKGAPPAKRLQVTYIIPFKADASGKLTLPVSSLRLYVGDQILLVGEEQGKSLKTSTQNGLLQKVEATDKNAKGTGLLVYEAAQTGTDTLALSRAGSDKYLPVDIIRE